MIKKVFIFALAAVMLVGAVFMTGCGCGGRKKAEAESLKWPNSDLAKMLPTPENPKGEIIFDYGDNLWIELAEVEQDYYDKYYNECVESKGFSLDTDGYDIGSSIYYNAYNNEGYRLSLQYDTDDKILSINIDGPLAKDTLNWPSSEIAQMIPVPDSTKGTTNKDSSDCFSIYVGDYNIDAFNAYVDKCMEAGFQVDYDRTDKRFKGKNDAGYRLTVSYEGGNTMLVKIEEPEAETTEATETTTETTAEAEPETTTEANAAPASGLRPEFKKAMDDYEDFIDEYVDFAEAYNANSSDLTLIAKYGEMMSKYFDMSESFYDWDTNSMSSEEYQYYYEVMDRTTSKLYSVGQ